MMKKKGKEKKRERKKERKKKGTAARANNRVPLCPFFDIMLYLTPPGCT